MKRVTALILAGALIWPAGLWAQPAPEQDDRYSFEFREADVQDVLFAIGQEAGFNMMLGEGVSGKLTISFQRVALMDVFHAILRQFDLTAFREGSIVRVMKSPLPPGEESLVTRMIEINFDKAAAAAANIQPLLSSKGKIVVDSRANVLIIRDVPENVEALVQLLKGTGTVYNPLMLDSRDRQVLIEARIVEATSNLSRELGVQWGGRFLNTSGATTLEVTGAPQTGGVGPSGAPFAVNLPARVAPGEGGGIGMAFGLLPGQPGATLDLRLLAMERTGRGKVLSAPRILTLNNKPATISAGTDILIPVTTVAAAGATATTAVQTISATLALVVTPRITPEGAVIMHISLNKKEPDFTRTVGGIPSILTRTAETDLIVDDRETIVIGGIFTRNAQKSVSGVPWLSKIPLLGWLFRRQSTEEVVSELLVFISPTVVKG